MGSSHGTYGDGEGNTACRWDASTVVALRAVGPLRAAHTAFLGRAAGRADLDACARRVYHGTYGNPINRPWSGRVHAAHCCWQCLARWWACAATAGRAP